MVDYVLTGLVKRRAWIAGEIERKYAESRQLVIDLEAVDATILQFGLKHQVEAR